MQSQNKTGHFNLDSEQYSTAYWRPYIYCPITRTRKIKCKCYSINIRNQLLQWFRINLDSGSSNIQLEQRMIAKYQTDMMRYLQEQCMCLIQRSLFDSWEHQKTIPISFEVLYNFGNWIDWYSEIQPISSQHFHDINTDNFSINVDKRSSRITLHPRQEWTRSHTWQSMRAS